MCSRKSPKKGQIPVWAHLKEMSKLLEEISEQQFLKFLWFLKNLYLFLGFYLNSTNTAYECGIGKQSNKLYNYIFLFLCRDKHCL